MTTDAMSPSSAPASAAPAGPAPLTPHREQFRAAAVAAIPRWYNPWAHLGLTSTIGLAVIAFAFTRLSHPTLLHWLAVPVTLIASNLFEWRAHKDLLHRRRWPLHELYDRHTPMHHMVYGYDDMALRSTREMRLVLLPAVGIAGIIALATPFALLAGRAFGANSGWLVLASSAAYVLGYEWSHLAYHLSPESFVGRLRLVRVLRELHRRHHHPRLMQKWNFNVTVPLGDWLHRTILSDAQLARTLEDDRARAARGEDPAALPPEPSR